MGLVSASKVFSGVSEPDLVLWNSMISGYSFCEFWAEGLRLFNRIRENGKQQPDGYTLVGIISGLIDFSQLGIGLGIHGLCLKSGFDCSAYVGSALVSMYSRFKCMNLAYGVFISLCQPDLLAWSALITGYSRYGDHKKALFFYRNLSVDGKKADSILIASILVAAAHLADVRCGSEIHGLGILVFDNMSNRNVVSYNSVISGLGLHGLAVQAFKLFEEMIETGMKPDESTFSSLLCACCHSGLVKDGGKFSGE
ncbi:hypothetical protein GH714_040661 [Hevea brasiliensis]|uniref:Pentatricopeptide repeat-containing protein n=1 Tax=Hevea brasiliensis TaxID=3981 RepID=A0A6A6KYX2_HEVBR|nr:hypothetical protein GH714_040661 [Hevea brasiliensis]